MKIKIILAILSLSFITHAQAECKKKINNSKVMLFVDVNESGEEIDTAEKAACERGQKLVVVPNNHKEYEAKLANTKNAHASYIKCMKKNPNTCNKELEEVQKRSTEYSTFTSKQTPLKQKLQDQLASLKKDKVSLENVTISGHDGGGHFGGAKGNIDRNQFLDIMKDYKDINNVKSVLLLGCYTGVPKQIMDWTMVFPDLRILGGYDGSAPLASRPEGHDYLYELLMNEKSLTSNADQKRLQSVLNKNFDSLKNLNASMFLRPACQPLANEKSFYYGKARGPELKEFELNECMKATKDLLETKAKLDKFDSGDKEPPVDTTNGEMRAIYNMARRFEHCSSSDEPMVYGDNSISEGSIVSAQKAFGLLFHQGFKDNFSNYYDKEMNEVENIVKAMDKKEIDEAEANYNKMIDSQEKSLAEYVESMNLLESNPTAYIDAKKEIIKNKSEEYNKIVSDPAYASLLKKFPSLVLDSKVNINNGYYGSQATEEETIQMMSLLGRVQEIYSLRNSVEMAENPKHREMVLSTKNQMIGYKTKSIERLKLNLVKGREQLEAINKVWIPTKENIKGKTRKEIMENAHAISGVLASPLLPTKTRMALSWASDVTQRRLVEFEAPFSWHEYTGKVDSPERDVKLEQYLSGNQFGGGYSSYGGVGGYPGIGGGSLGMGYPGIGGGGLGTGNPSSTPAEGQTPAGGY